MIVVQFEIDQFKKIHILARAKASSKQASYLSQLFQHDLEVLVLVHLLRDAAQVVSDDGGVEAAVELIHVEVIKREDIITDGHLRDGSDRALVFYKVKHSQVILLFREEQSS